MIPKLPRYIYPDAYIGSKLVRDMKDTEKEMFVDMYLAKDGGRIVFMDEKPKMK